MHHISLSLPPYFVSYSIVDMFIFNMLPYPLLWSMCGIIATPTVKMNRKKHCKGEPHTKELLISETPQSNL